MEGRCSTVGSVSKVEPAEEMLETEPILRWPMCDTGASCCDRGDADADVAASDGSQGTINPKELCAKVSTSGECELDRAEV